MNENSKNTSLGILILVSIIVIASFLSINEKDVKDPLAETGTKNYEASNIVKDVFDNEKITSGVITNIDSFKRQISIELSITDTEKVLAGDFKYGKLLPKKTINRVLSVDQRVVLDGFNIGEMVLVVTDKSLHQEGDIRIVEIIKKDFVKEEPVVNEKEEY